MNHIIFPHQLYHDISHLKDINNIYLVEEPRYFTDFKFHKMKLAYHRASMKKYYDYLKKRNINVHYIEYDMVDTIYKKLKQVSIVKPDDHKLEKKLKKIFKKKLVILPNKTFLIKPEEMDEIKNLIYKNGKYHHDEFYKYQRKKLDVLMKNDKPVGGKWSYDNMNRVPLPKKIEIPKIPK